MSTPNGISHKLVDFIDLAIQLANSVQADIEENPDAASNETAILLIKMRQAHDALDNDLENESGLQ